MQNYSRIGTALTAGYLAINLLVYGLQWSWHSSAATGENESDISEEQALSVAIDEIAKAANEAHLDGQLPAAARMATTESFTVAVEVLTSSADNLVASFARRIASGNLEKPGEFINVIDVTKRQVLDMLCLAKGCVPSQGSSHCSIQESARDIAGSVLSLLSLFRSSIESPVIGTASDGAITAEIQAARQAVAESVRNAIESVASIEHVSLADYDSNVVAERELLIAATSIEAAALQLAELKPLKGAIDESFSSQIVEAAKAITAATAALIKSATSVQREIITSKSRIVNSATTLSAPHYYFSGAWTEGLVSGAKNVALATGDLCEAANAAVKGEVERTRVIAAARSVSASTQQLLSAAAVKADPNSKAQVRLRAAGKSVAHATDSLVKAAEQSAVFDESLQAALLVKGSRSNLAMQRAQELEAQSRVLQIEKELEAARKHLASVRKDKYATL
jgi:talin